MLWRDLDCAPHPGQEVGCRLSTVTVQACSRRSTLTTFKPAAGDHVIDVFIAPCCRIPSKGASRPAHHRERRTRRRLHQEFNQTQISVYRDTGGALTKNGASTLILTADNSYAGGTTINAGILQVGNGGASGSVGTGPVLDDAALVFDRSGTVAVPGAITGTGSLTQEGPGGTLVLTGANTYSGGTTIAAGTLQLGAGGTTGSIVGNVANTGTLAFDRSDTTTFAGVISGLGAVAQIGSGTTILTGSNSYGGGTAITAGTLQLGNGGTAGSITGNVVDNGALAFDRSDPVSFGGTISGTGAVNQIGTGSTTLTAANTYSGGTLLAAGELIAGNISALGTGALTVGANAAGTTLDNTAAAPSLANAIILYHRPI